MRHRPKPMAGTRPARLTSRLQLTCLPSFSYGSLGSDGVRQQPAYWAFSDDRTRHMPCAAYAYTKPGRDRGSTQILHAYLKSTRPWLVCRPSARRIDDVV